MDFEIRLEKCKTDKKLADTKIAFPIYFNKCTIFFETSNLLQLNCIFYIILNKVYKTRNIHEGYPTWPNQDDRMNMTEIGEHDQKIDNNKH